MTKQTRTILKGYFETGDIPTQGQYQDLIDSQLSLLDTDVQIVSGTISSSFLEVQHHITSSGNISSSGNFIVNQITASGDISSSGIITGEGLVISDDAEITDILTVKNDIHLANSLRHEGDTSTRIDFGVGKMEATADSIMLRGPVTASGDISASGTIYANDFKSSGGDVSGVTFHDDLNVTGSITASGDISSSNTVIGNVGTFT